MADYNKGDTVGVEITVQIPDAANREQVIKWIEYQLGFTGGIDCENPLADCDLEADKINVLI